MNFHFICSRVKLKFIASLTISIIVFYISNKILIGINETS